MAVICKSFYTSKPIVWFQVLIIMWISPNCVVEVYLPFVPAAERFSASDPRAGGGTRGHTGPDTGGQEEGRTNTGLDTGAEFSSTPPPYSRSVCIQPPSETPIQLPVYSPATGQRPEMVGCHTSGGLTDSGARHQGTVHSAKGTYSSGRAAGLCPSRNRKQNCKTGTAGCGN